MVKRLRHRPFTAVTRVRFPLESLAVKLIQSAEHYADVAQLAEQLICNQQVIGSSPIIGLPFCGPLAQLVRATGYGWLADLGDAGCVSGGVPCHTAAIRVER